MSEGARRAKWPLAVVVKVLSSEVVQLRLRGHLTRRASCLLYPLEAEGPWEGSPVLHVPEEDIPVSQDPAQDDEAISAEDEPPEEDQGPRSSRCGRAIHKPARFL